MEKKKTTQIKINLPKEKAQGTYCNFSLISHSAAEFIIDFARVMPGTPESEIKDRIIMAPMHAKTLLFTLQENIAKYESQHGEIKMPERPNNPPFGMVAKPSDLPN